MSAWHDLMLVAILATATQSAWRMAQSDGRPLSPIECGMQYRGCACTFVEREGWQCRGFVPRQASEEVPKFPEEERSRPIPIDPSEVVPIQ